MGNIRLYGSTSGYTELAPPAVAPDGVLSLPSGTGTIATQAYVDTAESDAIAAGGLVHIQRVTAAAAATISVDNCFTSTYENYKLVMNMDGGTATIVQFRMRVGGADNSTAASYILQRLLVDSTTVAGLTNNNNFGQLIYTTTVTPQNGFAYIMRPQLAEETNLLAHNASLNNSGMVNLYTRHNQAVAYDGITFFANTGTFSGTIDIYGMSF